METLPIARVNGVALHAAGEVLAVDELRQRACTELLRQAAQREGSLAATDEAPIDGAIGYNPAVTHTCRPTPDRPAKGRRRRLSR